MLKKENRFDSYAYRISSRPLDASVTTLEEGQWVTLNASGKVIVSDGTKKSFMALSSKRDGRDNLGAGQNCTYVYGHGEFSTNMVDAAQTYAPMTALKVTTGGKLTVATASDTIVAYALSPILDGFVRIMLV